MPQVLAVADFDIEFKDYAAGTVITFADEALVEHLKTRKVVSTVAADVAAAAAAGAVAVVHSAGSPPFSLGGSVAVVVSGTPGVGNVLTAAVDSSYGGTPAYQWLRGLDGASTLAGAVAIAGATSSTYLQVSGDQGRLLGCRVSGLIAPAASASGAVPVAPVVGVAPSIVTAPSITSTPTVGQTVGAQTYSVGSYSGTPAPSTALDSWLLDGSVVSTGYTLAEGDAGKNLQVRLSVSNASGAIQATAVAVAVQAVISGSSGNWFFASAFSAPPSDRYNTSAARPRLAGRKRELIGSGARSKLRVLIPNWSMGSGGNNLPASFTRFALECNGVSVPVTFGGLRTATMTAGQIKLESDDILPSSFGLARFERGQECFLWAECVAEPGINRVILANRFNKSSGQRLVQYNPANTSVNFDSTGPLTVTGSDFNEFTSSSMNEISCTLIGTFEGADQPVWGSIGDSIVAGVGEVNTSGNDVSGFFQRAMFDADMFSNPVANFKFAVSGYRYSQFVSYLSQLQVWMAYANRSLDELGTNDFDVSGSAITVTQAQTYANQIWTMLGNAGIPPSRRLRTELMLRTTSTDGFATEANQTITGAGWGAGGNVELFNQWLRTQAPSAVAQCMRFVHPYGTTNQYVWAVPSRTQDGIHPREQAHAEIGTELRPIRVAMA